MEMDYLPPAFVDHAFALGAVCIKWSHLEMFLEFLIRAAAPFEEKDEVTFQTIFHNIDIREKIQILIGLGFLKKPSEKWFAILKWCLEETDNELRVRRNRFVHDRWGITKDGVTKSQAKTGLRKPQAFQMEYYTKIETLVPAADLWALSRDISAMTIRIFALLITFRNGRVLPHLEELLQAHAPLPHDLKLPT